MTKGAQTGKTDCAWHDLRVGDKIKDRNSGLEYLITKYGTIQAAIAPDIIVKNWTGNDYILVERNSAQPEKGQKEAKSDVNEVKTPETPSEPEKPAREEKRAQNDEANAEAPKRRVGSKFPAGSKFVLIDGKRKLIKPGESIPVKSLEPYTDQQLVDELRSRGYDVKAGKYVNL